MSRHASLPLAPTSNRDPEPVVIPECWYALADASRVGGRKPLSVERLGRRWVLWRDEQGGLCCLPAACPHRGADLGLGRVREGAIECPYHGFRFAGAGTCTHVPCEGREARIPAGLHVDGPILREAHGLVWMWHGVGAPSPAEPAWIEGAPEPARGTSTWEERWDISFTRVMEGMQDLHHFPFAHRKVDPWRGRASRLDPFEFEAAGEHLRQHAGLRRDEPEAPIVASFDLEAMFPGMVYLRFGARVDGVVLVCPIDDARSWIWTRYRVRTGLGTLADRLASWLGLVAEFGLVQPDDKRMLASSWPQRAAARDHALVRADAQIAAWHKLRRARLGAAASKDHRSARLDAHRRAG